MANDDEESPAAVYHNENAHDDSSRLSLLSPSPLPSRPPSPSPLNEKAGDHDGHRPTFTEIRTYTKSRSYTLGHSRDTGRRKTRHGTDAAGANETTEHAVTVKETIIAYIRMRPVPHFTHQHEDKPTEEDQIVDFDGDDDPYHPVNWAIRKKIITTATYGFLTMSATWASSSYSAGTRLVAKEFDVGIQTATLGTTLFLFGFGVGPLLWAPLSELYGRRMAVLVPMFVAICFTFGSATAKDFQTLMITRFFGAFFSSAPVTNTGGVLGDMYPAGTRGFAMAGYAMAVVGGPVVGQYTLLSFSLSLILPLREKDCVFGRG